MFCMFCYVQEVKITQINNASCTTASEKHSVLKEHLAFSEPLGWNWVKTKPFFFVRCSWAQILCFLYQVILICALGSDTSGLLMAVNLWFIVFVELGSKRCWLDSVVRFEAVLLWRLATILLSVFLFLSMSRDVQILLISASALVRVWQMFLRHLISPLFLWLMHLQFGHRLLVTISRDNWMEII